MAAPGAGPELALRRSPGGTLEVDPDRVLAHVRDTARGRTRVRVVDIRDTEELTGELGHIEGVEHVPLAQVPEVAERWDPEQPVVLICRTGRRSARAAAELERLGMRNVGAMTGGMLLWNERDLPVSRDLRTVRVIRTELRPVPSEVTVRGAPGAPTLTIDPGEVRWVRVASLLSSGSESCVDGRDPHAVIGTPGGDAGELIVATATAESLGHEPLPRREVESLVDDWIEAFGRFYVHSDVHALEHLRRAVLADSRFRAEGVAPCDVAEMEALVRRPPHALEDALLEHLVEPEHVGCGHLRAMILNPADYRIRPGLTEDVLRATFRHLWRAPEDVDWVVLQGEHHEGAVVVVRLEGEVHPYTKVPAIPPSIDGTQTFVLHPEVTAYLREENASFLLERSLDLARRVDRAVFVERLEAIADVQLRATLDRLAQGLPVYEARFERR